ncbi:unnamed protein product [Linum tenue]|uniref:Tetraspanin-19 n=1 Tax=Linum tenue TaxID=586396 RepID=A0AAV0QX94_9ROSI|nr:unnamed protein product [Linum tenue]
MVRLMRSCVQSILKLVNSVVGMVGLAMVLYAVWLIKAWQREIGEFPFGEDENYPAPWYKYMMFMFVLVMVEAAVTADVFLNRDWEKDFPKDPSGSFDKFKDFIRLHFEICKWVGLSIVAVQGLSVLLAVMLKGLGPHPYYDSDDDYIPERSPLLRHRVFPPGYVVGNPILAPRTDTWSIRVNEKVR